MTKSIFAALFLLSLTAAVSATKIVTSVSLESSAPRIPGMSRVVTSLDRQDARQGSSTTAAAGS